ncbi:MAG TPA: carboxylating nicotinate-nucleotide diphosphorylase [Deltaproteobacteria bacterium]|nr:carboxylating nicotinate-nucleotide diphosphorylase [Deltaproteobacteria bacterium]
MEEFVELLVRTAVVEDMGEGDITTDSVVDGRARGEAAIVARERLVLAGLFVAERVFRTVDDRLRVRRLADEGSWVRRGATVAVVKGPLASILKAERTALNFLQRLCAVATLTRRFVDRTARRGVRITDTRKTTPCMRVLERYAVRAGGGENHRFGLFDAVLIKDNHLAAVKVPKGGSAVAEAVRLARERHPDMSIEVETATLAQVREAVAAGADVIMLDNMSEAKMKRAVEIVDGRALVEISGGVTLENVARLARLGADFISVGALTHSAPAADLSLKIVK